MNESEARDANNRSAELRARQEDAWRAGNLIRVEELISELPSPNALTDDQLLELIQGEIVLRAARGQKPNLEEFADRFPSLSHQMSRLFEIQQELQSESAKGTEGLTTVDWQRVHHGGDSTSDGLGDLATQTAAGPRETPRCFGDYVLLAEIARGGMGVVYKAQQKKLDREVALKMILAGEFASEEGIRRFYMEAQAAAKLDHPNIVPIFEVGESEGRPFYSMGYVDGQSLAKKIAGGPLPPEEAAVLVRKLALAIAYAHAQGVIHRDLKPQNVLLDGAGQPRITDFGLAKRVEGGSDLTSTGQVLGTPSYMPPEQARGDIKSIGPAADVYSLGAILYCLLTGRPPFQAASVMETLQQVLAQRPVAPRVLIPSVAPDLETICLKCLEKEPPHRYESAQAVAEELQCYLDGRPITARPVGKLERGLRWCKRNPTQVRLGAVALSLAAAMLIGGVYFYHAYSGATQQSKQTMALLNQFDGILSTESFAQSQLLEAERLLETLDKLDPERAAARRERLLAAVVDASLRELNEPRLSAELQQRIETRIEWLEGRKASEAVRLQNRLAQRLRD